MNPLKPLLVLAALAAIVYGAYTWVNRNPDAIANLEDAPLFSRDATGPAQGNAAPVPPGNGPTGSGLTNSPPLAHAQAPASGLPAPGSPNQFTRPHAPQGGLPGDTRIAPGGSVAPVSHVRPAFPPAGPAATATGVADDEFTNSMQAVRKKLQENRLQEAHRTLSKLYIKPLSQTQASQITAMLDQLAGDVIYSREHHLEKPYLVRSGDTLPQIARTYEVPWLLLARINGVRDPLRLQPDRELKVIQGPFDALISLSGQELTLVLKGSYAGRFPVRTDPAQTNLEGLYVVGSLRPNLQDARPDQVTVDHTVAPDSRTERWIGLSSELGQHPKIYLYGTTGPSQVSGGVYGAIRLSDRGMDDLCTILSIGSRVEILP